MAMSNSARATCPALSISRASTFIPSIPPSPAQSAVGRRLGDELHRSHGVQNGGLRKSPMGSPRKSTKTRFVQEEKENVREFDPEPRSKQENGWQAQVEGIKPRIGSLFNSFTMSDVVFRVEMQNVPAHKFVLAAASPVFHKQFFEDHLPLSESTNLAAWHRPSLSQLSIGCLDIGGPSANLSTVNVTEVPHLHFLMFVRFIYTDAVDVTLDNVLSLVYLADTYKVSGLIERCFEFLHLAVVPKSVVKVIAILRRLMLKGILGFWRDLIVERKAVDQFNALSLADRRSRMAELEVSPVGRGLSPRKTLAGGFQLPGRRGLSRSNSRASSRAASNAASSFDEDFHDSDMLDHSQSAALAIVQHARFQGQMLPAEAIGRLINELSIRCWKCVKEDTENVIVCPHMFNEDVKFLREILRLDVCNVSEITLFQAMSAWAESACARQGLAPTAEHCRAVLGDSTIELIRFPTMSLQEFQWEVVPKGLLPHKDVRLLLDVISRGLNVVETTTGIVGRFSGKPRGMWTIKAIRAMKRVSRVPTTHHMAVLSQAYIPCKEDPVDTVLAAELFRFYLTQTGESHRETLDDAGPGELDLNSTCVSRPITVALAATSQSKLPPIGLASPRQGCLAISTLDTGQPAPSQVGLQRARRRGLEAAVCVSKRPDTSPHPLSPPEARGGVVARPSAISLASPRGHPRPADFRRLGSGLYVFQGEQLLEVWLERGEAMVKDHGYDPRLACLGGDPMEDAAVVHHLLGERVGQQGERSGGIPLHCLLSQR